MSRCTNTTITKTLRAPAKKRKRAPAKTCTSFFGQRLAALLKYHRGLYDNYTQSDCSLSSYKVIIRQHGRTTAHNINLISTITNQYWIFGWNDSNRSHDCIDADKIISYQLKHFPSLHIDYKHPFMIKSNYEMDILCALATASHGYILTLTHDVTIIGTIITYIYGVLPAT
jgi:hypothetical protein